MLRPVKAEAVGLEAVWLEAANPETVLGLRLDW